MERVFALAGGGRTAEAVARVSALYRRDETRAGFIPVISEAMEAIGRNATDSHLPNYTSIWSDSPVCAIRVF